jgi:hypothetical protein
MDAVRQVLHELINIVHGHGLPKGRADELHDILNGVDEAVQDAEATDPADREAEIAELERQLAKLRGPQAPADPEAPATAGPAA